MAAFYRVFDGRERNVGVGMKTSGLQRRFTLVTALAASSLASAQRTPHFGMVTPTTGLIPPAMIRLGVPCATAVEPFDVDDYDGPFNQLVARFSQRVEKATVHLPRHRNGLKPCSLSAGEKFQLFVDQQVDPINLMGAEWDAWCEQLEREDR